MSQDSRGIDSQPRQFLDMIKQKEGRAQEGGFQEEIEFIECLMCSTIFLEKNQQKFFKNLRNKKMKY